MRPSPHIQPRRRLRHGRSGAAPRTGSGRSPARRLPGALRGLRGRPGGLTPGRVAGMRAVVLATTHERSELFADVVVHDLSAASAQATHGGVEITAAD